MNWTKLIINIVAIYGGLLFTIFIFQRSILYVPPTSYLPPQVAGASPALKEISVTTEDGLGLRGWYAPASSKALTIILFHGNGAGLDSMAFVPTPYISTGYGFLSAEYRGYGGLPGKPNEQGLYADARAYIKFLIASGVPEQNIILYGHSLGSGVAVQMAKEFHVRGVILLAPYLSIPEMAQVRFPIFPAKYLVKDRFDNAGKIPDIHIPLLIANGGKDNVIPPAQGRQLFELANEPKHYVFVPEGGHNDLFDTEFLPASLQWLQERDTTASPHKGS